MLVFTRRPLGFKIGLLLLVVSLILYTTGFASPYWTSFDVTFTLPDDGMNYSEPFFMELTKSYSGLWETCERVFFDSNKHCSSFLEMHHVPGWMKATQFFQCVGLIGLVVSTGYALVVNFIRRSPSINNRHQEILLITSGILGFMGCIIYAAKTSDSEEILEMEFDNNDDDDLFFNVEYFEQHEYYSIDKNTLGWGCFISLMSCILSLVAAAVLCANNRLIQAQETETTPAGVSFSAAGASTGRELTFLPPHRLAGGFNAPPPPTPNLTQEQAAEA